MTAAETNKGLAEALGVVMHPHEPMWMPPGEEDEWKAFNPATSSDHLRLYVLPEIIKRGPSSMRKFQMKILEMAPCPLGLGLDRATWFLVQPPAVLAAAALKVLRGEG